MVDSVEAGPHLSDVADFTIDADQRSGTSSAHNVTRAAPRPARDGGIINLLVMFKIEYRQYSIICESFRGNDFEDRKFSYAKF